MATLNNTTSPELHETEFAGAAQILAGLLASGHYSSPPRRRNDEPEILRFRAPDRHALHGYTEAQPSRAVSEAIRLWQELKDSLSLRYRLDAGESPTVCYQLPPPPETPSAAA